MTLAPVFDLLRDLEGHDVDKMPEVEARSFCSTALNKFRVASAVIPRIVLGPEIVAGYSWHVEPSEFFTGYYVGSFKLIHTGQMEAALGEPVKLQMAAALFPGVTFEIELFCDFHREGGLQSVPRLEVSIGTNGRESLDSMATELLRVGSAIAEALDGPGVLDTRIVAREGACEDAENPRDMYVAFKEVAGAAITAAREAKSGNGDALITECVEIRVGLVASHARAASTAERVIQLLGTVFTALSHD